MTNIFLDGFSALQNHFWIIVCILVLVIWGWLATYMLLVNFFGSQFTNAEYFSFSSVGFIFPLLIWAGLFFCINFLFGKTLAIIFSIAVFVIPFFFLKIRINSPTTFGVILFFIVSLIIRLAFLEQATLPSYFDSAEHYRLIKLSLGIFQRTASVNDLFLSIYYHKGYHFLISALIYLFQLNIPDAMLVFGQIILAVLPLSFFFIIRQETDSDAVAFFTCLIASFGFHMPAHLVNWGKYPALLSLLGIQFVFILEYLIFKKSLCKEQKLKIYWLIVFLIFITVLIHTRALIVFLLTTLAVFVMLWQKKISTQFKYVSILIVFLILAIELFYVQQNTALFPLVTGYAQRDLWALILVLLLTPFVVKSYPNLMFFLSLLLCFFIALLFFPIPFFTYGTQTLLDRPFVQMLAYITLSTIAGLGFAGLLHVLQNLQKAKLLISFVLFCFVIFNVSKNYSFYPSDCCQLASQDDLSALEWIDKELPQNARILIASNPLYVTSFESPKALTGADAGIWITPLTSRFTLLSPANSDFDTSQTHSELCVQQISYIYIGNMPQSFNNSQLQSQSNWYHLVFDLPNTQIYQINCQ